MPGTGALLLSHAAGVAPTAQTRREQALLEGAALGELHLHVSTLRGDVVGLGTFHQEPHPPLENDVAPWRRRTGGCAVACGTGFAVVTLALPHRAALVADAPSALKPEQVMNRCVRGLLAWLRGGGIEPIYPGLDAITVARRTLAHLGFAETRDGPTLFQAIVAIDASFADTATLLDRLDPDGRVPMRLVASDDCTSLAALGRAPRGDVDVAAVARDVAAAYAATFPAAIGEIDELDAAVTALLETREAVGDAAVPPAPELPATGAVEHGHLGQVAAAARIDGGRVSAFALAGDFLAPWWALDELRARIEGGPPSADAVLAAADAVFDGSRGYLLGLSPEARHRLLVRAVTEAA